MAASRTDIGPLAERYSRRFDATVAECTRQTGFGPPPDWPRLRIPPALMATLHQAMRLAGPSIDEDLAAFYADKMPALLVEQLFDRSGSAQELLWRPLDTDRLPSLAAGLDGLFRELTAVGLDPMTHLGASDRDALLARCGNLASLYAPTQFGSGLPMLGASRAERVTLARRLDSGESPDAVLDRCLSGNLLHELCHGLQREASQTPGQAPWMVQESAAIDLGLAAFPRHVFPEVAGEAVPAAGPFVLMAQVLGLLFGRRALWSSVSGALDPALEARTLTALAVAEWQAWLALPRPPVAPMGDRIFAWIKLVALSRGTALDGELAIAESAWAEGTIDAVPDLLAAAEGRSWQEAPWYWEKVGPAELAATQVSVRSLFVIHRLAPNLQAHPAELPDGRFEVDVEACRLIAPARPDGVWGEPAQWLLPLPVARCLRERGVARVEVTGASRQAASAIAGRLLDLATAGGPAPREVNLQL